MTTGMAGEHVEADVRPEIPIKSFAGWCNPAILASPTGSGNSEGRWEVEIRPNPHRITRVTCYRLTSRIGTQDYKEPEEVIWPTWPATIEEEAEVATTPLADLQRYWSKAGNRLRESAKWMATVLGAAMAAVIGTSPVAHLNSHHFRIDAAVIALAGLLCLAITMILVLRVMQPPEVSFEQIEAANKQLKAASSASRFSQNFSSLIRRHEKSALCRWKQKVETHPDLYLPCGVERLGELRWSIGLEDATLVQLARCWEDKADSDVAESLKSAQEARAARLLELRTAAARITAIGEYYALQARSTQARLAGTAFGFLGTALIVLAFAWPLTP